MTRNASDANKLNLNDPWNDQRNGVLVTESYLIAASNRLFIFFAPIHNKVHIMVKKYVNATQKWHFIENAAFFIPLSSFYPSPSRTGSSYYSTLQMELATFSLSSSASREYCRIVFQLISLHYNKYKKHKLCRLFWQQVNSWTWTHALCSSQVNRVSTFLQYFECFNLLSSTNSYTFS